MRAELTSTKKEHDEESELCKRGQNCVDNVTKGFVRISGFGQPHAACLKSGGVPGVVGHHIANKKFFIKLRISFYLFIFVINLSNHCIFNSNIINIQIFHQYQVLNPALFLTAGLRKPA